jgi:hypothetical protein
MVRFTSSGCIKKSGIQSFQTRFVRLLVCGHCIPKKTCPLAFKADVSDTVYPMIKGLPPFPSEVSSSDLS